VETDPNDWEWEDPPDDLWGDGEDDRENEWVLDCGLKDCCMPGYHYRHECHTPEMIEAQNAEYEAESTRCTCHFGDGSLFHLPDCPRRS